VENNRGIDGRLPVIAWEEWEKKIEVNGNVDLWMAEVSAERDVEA
jgi:hypothetical protein